MPWCQWVAPSGCSVHRGHFPGCFMAPSHELNICCWPPMLNITTASLARCMASLKMQKWRVVGVLWLKLSNNYSMAEQRCAVSERSWCIGASASSSSALIGEREGIPSSAINDNNTITCIHVTVTDVLSQRMENLFTASSSSKIYPVTLLSVHFKLSCWL